MFVLGIIGFPVSHSKSPAMHGAAARALGIDAVYARFPVDPADVGAAIAGIRALGIHGANVTVPHKQAVIPFLDAITDDARAIGAVNTIVREGARLVGHNTDARGLVRSLEEAHVALDGAVVTVLGAGGAARAAIVGLANAGARRIHIAARRGAEAEALARELSTHVRAELTSVSLDALVASFAETTLLVQGTSATLKGGPEADRFAASLPLEALPADATVVDLVYDPLETSVLARARARGLAVVDGLGMLLYQGAVAFTLWTGREPSIDVMREALRNA